MKILIIILCLFMFTGCDNAKKNPTQSPESNTETPVETDYESEYYQIIGLAEFKSLYASSDPKLIYFGSDGCSACLSFKPIAKQFAKENKVNVYFVNLDKLTNEENEELGKLVEFQYIPFVTIYKNKKQLYGDSGVIQLSELKSLAIEKGVLSE